VLEQIAATGVDQVSAGDTLEVNFREAKRGAGTVEVAHAVQQGNVAMTRTVPAVLQQGATGPDVQHAVAQRADYEGDAGDGDANRLILTGAAQVTDAQSVLWANRVVMQQGSGDATAEGAVKVTYLQQPANGSSSANAQPVHVLAERAEMEHDAGRATFYGASGGTGRQMARMWQSGATGEGGSQVEAPVLVFEQKGKRLTARGADGGAAMAVHTVLVSAPHGNRSGGASGGSGGSSASQPGAAKRTSAHGAVAGAGNGTGLQGSGPQVIRVTSREMVYTDAARQAEFTGGVRVLDTDGEQRAQQAARRRELRSQCMRSQCLRSRGLRMQPFWEARWITSWRPGRWR
jgi:lipopolysaccharide export system protein LptA